ncbi:ATP-grasp domain-containing protein [Paenibacillus tarimensis]
MKQPLVQNVQNKLILNKAIDMGMECRPLIPGCEDFLELSYIGKQIVINKTRSDKLPLIAGLLAKNKDASSHLLKRAGLPVPGYIVLSQMGDEAVRFMHMNKSVVVKPLDASCSAGVTLGIEKEYELENAIKAASSYSEKIIIQKYIDGYDYRVLVIDGRVVGVLEYQPAFIQGDGISTIKQLIDQLNEERLGRDTAGDFDSMKRISTGSNRLLFNLGNQGKGLLDILGKGERVQLFFSGDVSTEEELTEIIIDRTEEICPVNAGFAIQAAKALRIDVAGIDIRCKNISVPLDRSTGGILEVNALPDFMDHVFPFRGASRDVAKAYLQYLIKE